MNELEKAVREAYGNGFDDTPDDPDYVDSIGRLDDFDQAGGFDDSHRWGA